MLLVGRECAGADPSNCLIVSDPAVSRDHLQIRAAAGSQSTIVDLSSNGTRVNGQRIERDQPIPLADGDRIELGSVALTFRADVDDEPIPAEAIPAEPIPELLKSTIREAGSTVLAIAVGDIVGYAELVERHGAGVVAEATGALFAALGELLPSYPGAVSNFSGGAIFAAWDALRDPDGAARAVDFTLTASELVAAHPSAQTIRDADGAPLQMGWAVTLGEVALGRSTAGHEALHGDAAILAFRVAGLAARGGRAPVLVSGRAASAAQRAAQYGAREELHPEGYSSVTWVRAATRVAT
jgi:adenylate cyclase